MNNRTVYFICADINDLWKDTIEQLSVDTIGLFNDSHDEYDASVSHLEDTIVNTYEGLIP
jgi:hypothetical protein